LSLIKCSWYLLCSSPGGLPCTSLVLGTSSLPALHLLGAWPASCCGLILFKWPCLLSFGCWVWFGGNNFPLMLSSLAGWIVVVLIAMIAHSGVCDLWCELLWWLCCCVGGVAGWLGFLGRPNPPTVIYIYMLKFSSVLTPLWMHMVIELLAWLACCPASLVPGWYFGWWLNGDKLAYWWLSTVFF
jgi:hypothetical protein